MGARCYEMNHTHCCLAFAQDNTIIIIMKKIQKRVLVVHSFVNFFRIKRIFCKKFVRYVLCCVASRNLLYLCESRHHKYQRPSNSSDCVDKLLSLSNMYTSIQSIWNSRHDPHVHQEMNKKSWKITTRVGNTRYIQMHIT